MAPPGRPFEPIEVVEWTPPADGELLARRFERHGGEFGHGARLVVGEGQAAVFARGGEAADAFGPGSHALDAAGLPLLAALVGWGRGQASKFKAEVYFVSTRPWASRKWGTPNPFVVRDARFGPVRARASGTFAVQVTDPRAFLRHLLAGDPSFETYEASAQTRDVVARFAAAVGRARLGVADLAGDLDAVARAVGEELVPDLSAIGLTLSAFRVEDVSLPDEVEQALGEQVKPPPVTVTYHVAIDGKPAGPFDAAAVGAKAREGKVTRNSLVWRPGMANWVAAGTVPELDAVLAPPPSPG